MTPVGELLHTDLHRVLGNRDAISRRRAIDEVFAENVRFSDPDETLVGRDALEHRAAGPLDAAPAS